MFSILVVMLVGLMKAHDGLHDSDDVEHQRFEEINHDIFMSRVVGVNYTEETINGEHIKYYITDTGDWHLDSCTVIGNNHVGLIGLYYHMTDQRRRLNPYIGDINGLGTWVGGDVPYVLDRPGLNMGNWQLAVHHYNTNTPIRLVDVTNVFPRPQYYIRVFRGVGCYGSLGRVNEFWTLQPSYQGNSLSLGTGCDSWLPTIVHEIGHNLGFQHTQKRSDRDLYVNVNYDNIQQSYWSQYDKTNDPLCGSYDCGSVMHYFDTAFGNGQGKTMTAKSSSCRIQRDTWNPLSTQDRLCLCELYPPGQNGHPAVACGSVITPSPSVNPTTNPARTISVSPTKAPTSSPTGTISLSPTETPSNTPTRSPVVSPTESPTLNTNNFCLRGRGLSGTNLFVNGNYIRQNYPDNNNNTYFKNDRISCDLMVYIYQYTRNYYNSTSNTFYSRTVWAINRELNAGAPIAICMENDVFNCDQKWIFGSNYDRNLRQTSGDCARVPCDTLRVAGTNSPCDGDYTEINDNYYANNGSGYVMIYNDFYEQYRCIEINNTQYINSCDDYDGIKASEYGVMPEVPSEILSPVQIQWSGFEGNQATLQCMTLTTSTTTTQVPRQSLQCGSFVEGSITPGGSVQIDWVANSGHFAYIFYSCYDKTDFDINIVVKTQNLENIIQYNDYSQNHCPDSPEKSVILLWRSSSNYEAGKTYTLDVTGNNGEFGDYKIAMFCYGTANDALNFGKNTDDQYISIFSFKEYGKVQWIIFACIVSGIIIMNIVILYTIAKCVIKRKEKQLKHKFGRINRINTRNAGIQQNIQLTENNDSDGSPTGI